MVVSGPGPSPASKAEPTLAIHSWRAMPPTVTLDAAFSRDGLCMSLGRARLGIVARRPSLNLAANHHQCGRELVDVIRLASGFANATPLSKDTAASGLLTAADVAVSRCLHRGCPNGSSLQLRSDSQRPFHSTLFAAAPSPQGLAHGTASRRRLVPPAPKVVRSLAAGQIGPTSQLASALCGSDERPPEEVWPT